MAWNSLIGKAAPSLTLPNYNGEPYTINPGKDGVPIALFFYPKAGSFGCTKEACQFRDALAGKRKRMANGDWKNMLNPSWSPEKDVFKDDRALVIGVSPDPVEKQKLFVEKEKLTVSDFSVVSKHAAPDIIFFFTVSRVKRWKARGSNSVQGWKRDDGLDRLCQGNVHYRWKRSRKAGFSVKFWSSLVLILIWFFNRDALDATMNYGAHSKFVTKWLEKLQKEQEVPPSAPAAPASE